jgi:dTDP-glucose pyrophosphorylase
VEGLPGDGSGFGVRITYVRQPRADGSADAVRRALAVGAQEPLECRLPWNDSAAAAKARLERERI